MVFDRNLIDPAVRELQTRRWRQRITGPMPWPRRALLVLGDRRLPVEAMHHAYRVTAELGAEIHVLRVLQPERRLLPSFRTDADAREASRNIERRSMAVSELRRWCDAVFPRKLPSLRLRTGVGHFITEAVTNAAELDAALVIVSPETRRLGAAAIAMVCATGRSVLIARPWTGDGPILVGMDLEEDDSLTLDHALVIAARAGAPVLALQNISGLSMAFRLPVPAPLPVAAQGVDGTDLGRLSAFDARCPLVSTRTTHEVSAADALVAQARLRRVPIVIVGSHRRSWYGRLVGPSMAAKVALRAGCSVLVTPSTRSQEVRTNKQ